MSNAQEVEQNTQLKQVMLSEDDDIDLREVFSVIWSGKWLIAFFIMVFSGSSFYYASTLPDIYRAQALLAPSQGQDGGISSSIKKLGGLAGLAGVSVGSGDTSKTTLALSILQSRKFLTQFAEKYQLSIPLYASLAWNGKDLVYNPELYDSDQQEWLIKNGQSLEPNNWDLYNALRSRLSVSENESGIVSISFEHFSPDLAAKWLELMIQDLNSVMKGRDVTEAERSIGYLEEQLQKTAVADMRAVFYQLIEEQTKTLMLAGVQKEYVFMVVDPPIPPDETVKPRRLFILFIGIAAGFMIGVLIVLMRNFLKAEEA